MLMRIMECNVEQVDVTIDDHDDRKLILKLARMMSMWKARTGSLPTGPEIVAA